jgi:hypothetical protein
MALAPYAKAKTEGDERRSKGELFHRPRVVPFTEIYKPKPSGQNGLLRAAEPVDLGHEQ